MTAPTRPAGRGGEAHDRGPADPAAARAAIERNSFWYHTIELAPGIATPGFVDLRGSAPKLLPDDLSGRRALDVGTFDGFWSFEMERRGAEVVSTDVDSVDSGDWPSKARPAHEQQVELGRGFRIAAECLESSVTRIECNVYDLSPEVLGGQVDFAFSGALLMHLRDPVRALERIRDSLSSGGTVVVREPISVWLSIRAPRRPAAAFVADSSMVDWWIPNIAGVAGWLRAAGFESIERLAITRPRTRRRKPQVYAGFTARRPTS